MKKGPELASQSIRQTFDPRLIRCDKQCLLVIVNDEAGLCTAWLADMPDQGAVHWHAARLLGLTEVGGKLSRFLQGSITEFFAADHDMRAGDIFRVQPSVIGRSQPVRDIFVLQVVFADIDVYALGGGKHL